MIKQGKPNRWFPNVTLKNTAEIAEVLNNLLKGKKFVVINDKHSTPPSIFEGMQLRQPVLSFVEAQEDKGHGFYLIAYNGNGEETYTFSVRYDPAVHTEKPYIHVAIYEKSVQITFASGYVVEEFFIVVTS